VPSKFVAKELIKYQPFTRNKLALTYEASDPPIKAKPMAVKGVVGPFILHVGAPYPHKNLDRLILAFDEVKKTQPKLQLVLPGKMKNQFKKDMEKWIDKSPNSADIITPGYMNGAELKWLYENAQMYVLPSLSEGFGLPGLEAMTHNCPVIASDNTCLPEVYGNAALYFNPFEVRDIAVEIEKVLTSTKLKKSLVAAGQTQLKKYSWDKLAKETLFVYDSIN
jgi:glycosyltransferase involved in cell wall biosynthesis